MEVFVQILLLIIVIGIIAVLIWGGLTSWKFKPEPSTVIPPSLAYLCDKSTNLCKTTNQEGLSLQNCQTICKPPVPTPAPKPAPTPQCPSGTYQSVDQIPTGCYTYQAVPSCPYSILTTADLNYAKCMKLRAKQALIGGPVYNWKGSADCGPYGCCPDRITPKLDRIGRNCQSYCPWGQWWNGRRCKNNYPRCKAWCDDDYCGPDRCGGMCECSDDDTCINQRCISQAGYGWSCDDNCQTPGKCDPDRNSACWKRREKCLSKCGPAPSPKPHIVGQDCASQTPCNLRGMIPTGNTKPPCCECGKCPSGMLPTGHKTPPCCAMIPSKHVIHPKSPQPSPKTLVLNSKMGIKENYCNCNC